MAELKKAGYRVDTINIVKTQSDAYYEGKADEVLIYLDKE